MIIVDRALEERAASGRPVQVGVVGAGFAGRGLVHQITASTPGMRVAVVANRSLDAAAQAYDDLGVDAGEVVTVSTAAQLEQAIAAGRPAITDDSTLVCAAGPVEAVVEITGEVEHGAHVAVGAIEHGKHLVLFNAELDSTLGPLLKRKADSAGVVMSNSDGDQPGVILNLAREARMLGFEPVVLGNIKSLLDHRRTPETQAAFAANVFQRPKHITSFADGTKICAEMVCVANASGFGVSTRGMEGPRCAHVDEAKEHFPVERLYHEGQGRSDYILGAEPSFGVFVLAYSESPFHQQYMKIYKMGDGPVYTFYRHCHLSPLETPLTIARAVLFGDASVTPLGGPVCDLIAMAKFDLRAGTQLDGIGGYTVYGTIENSPAARAGKLLPMGLADGCTLKRDVAQDAALTFDDVELPAGRLCDRLWQEQLRAFALTPA